MGKEKISPEHKVETFFFQILEGNYKEIVPKIIKIMAASTRKYTNSSEKLL